MWVWPGQGRAPWPRVKPGEDLVIGGVKELDAGRSTALTCAGEKPRLGFSQDGFCLCFPCFSPDEMEFSNWLCLPTLEFSPQVPLCSLVFVPLLSNLLRPGGWLLGVGFPPFSFWGVGLQENELDKCEGSPEGEEKKVSHCGTELRTDQSSQRERANVGQMWPGLGCGSVSPGVETRGEGWMRDLGLCFKGGQAKKKRKKKKYESTYLHLFLK